MSIDVFLSFLLTLKWSRTLIFFFSLIFSIEHVIVCYEIRCNTQFGLIYSLSTTTFIIFWDFLMFWQIFLSPQVKRYAITTYEHGIYELPNDLRLRKLGNYDFRKSGSIRKVSKPYRIIAQCPVSLPKWKF